MAPFGRSGVSRKGRQLEVNRTDDGRAYTAQFDPKRKSLRVASRLQVLRLANR